MYYLDVVKYVLQRLCFAYEVRRSYKDSDIGNVQRENVSVLCMSKCNTTFNHRCCKSSI